MNPTLQQLAEEYAKAKYPKLPADIRAISMDGYKQGYTAHAASVQEVLREAREALCDAKSWIETDYQVQFDPWLPNKLESILEKLKQFEQ